MEIHIPYGRQFIDEEDIKAVIKVLKSDYITQGPKISEFERKLADYCGAKYAVVFNSGTSALHGAYFSIGLTKGDEFITTPITFAATSNAGLYLGAKPIFVDIELETGNIDVSKIEEKTTKNTKAISVVHYAGHPVDMKNVKKIADKYNLKVVEDACHALGAKYENEKIGSCRYSDVTVFSFHPVKHITTGEGGAVLTNDQDVYEKLLMFRNHGITKDKGRFVHKQEGEWYYEMQFLGYNYRMTDIQAALGISQLKKLDRFVERRREIAQLYNEAFRDNPFFDIPVEKEYASHSYHLYPIRLKDKYLKIKEKIFDNLRKLGIGVQVHYIPVYWHPYYEKLGYRKGICPEAEDFYKREISLPIYPAMSNKDIEYVVKKVFKQFGD
ncbi:UDP-4-amino-4,6-dideoxy-N-acetyl-beta-L-altrosamine transaminase [Persephonella hydrogeniphila]|uniref:UDP-4-amino-4,6-dideoxy-N-acetyl-beta-L-altrosamine transaminase n=1 Tax=Persephonella hydrogeniphila TaxID=198703 RepID=A0A285N389_9AQUI|nr:UDP-4-amino-4,6-dideoxy-N-acetyl-beta-L-altrosamine transaminase [Persephonella hydrogeniphila]SNZ03788.1 UDP-4-amino-4,6-dideoxy-N-acetyl-beta-L-altrosamine transaminase [Persephonella hydrogeniphila]